MAIDRLGSSLNNLESSVNSEDFTSVCVCVCVCVGAPARVFVLALVGASVRMRVCVCVCALLVTCRAGCNNWSCRGLVVHPNSGALIPGLGRVWMAGNPVPGSRSLRHVASSTLDGDGFSMFVSNMGNHLENLCLPNIHITSTPSNRFY